jgi:hypothetical protein
MPALRNTSTALVCIALTACGGQDANDGFDGGTSAWSLTLVGAANLVVHPQDKRTLQVVLAQDQTGPVANAPVHFEFQDGDPAGGTLDSADVKTDSTGVATVHFTAGKNANSKPSFKVVASAPGYGDGAVAFSFSFIPVHRLLQIIGSSTTSASADGQSARVTLGVSTSGGLKVREMDADTGAPIAGDSVHFILPASAQSHWSGVSTASTSATTGTGGEAQAFLLTTGAAEGPLQVQALSPAGGAAVTFAVTVSSGGTGSSCTTNAQCGPGQICTGSPPTCQSGGSGTGCDSSGSRPCPAGYTCVNSTCQPPSGNSCDPAAPNCTSGYCCNPTTTQCQPDCAIPCATGTHCVAGSTCGGGSCVADGSVPDVTGTWSTKHDFDIAQAMPTTVRDIFEGIRLLDQALLGELTIPGLPGGLQDIINTFVSSLLQQYVPDWVQQIVHISDDLVTILSNLRGEGSMHIAQNGDLAHVKGTEVWTSLVFYWLPLCGGNIQGDPGRPPDCARLDIATTDSLDPGQGECKGQALPSIAVQVSPFTATVVGSGSGPYTLQVDDRNVKLKMGKVILVLVDYLIAIVSGGQYNCIDEATDCANGNTCMVDCPGLSQDISAALGGFISESTLEGLCDSAVTAAGQLATTALASAWNPTVDTLDFKGHATVSGNVDVSSCDPGSSGNCAAQLGNDDWDVNLNDGPVDQRDGNWGGTFFFVNNLPGAWEAKRPQ